MISNYPGMKIKPGSMGKAFPGITATVLDLKTHEPITEPGRVGLIAFRPGWPSMFRAYRGKPDMYRSKFVGAPPDAQPDELRANQNLWYVSGDRSSIDAEGYFWFVGRDDDVINTGGHLVGPFEVESALIEHEAVAEAAAVGKPDQVNMEVVKAFVTLNPGYAAVGRPHAGHHELHQEAALAARDAPGDRVRRGSPEDPLREDPQALPEGARVGRGPRGPVHARERLTRRRHARNAGCERRPAWPT